MKGKCCLADSSALRRARGTYRGETRPDPDALRSARRGVPESFLWFSRLPGAAVEARAVADMLGVAPVISSDALENAVLAMRSPASLHIAAHGFFLPEDSGTDSLTGLAEVLDLDRPESSPLLRSGIALAGANTWLMGGHLPPEAGDGLLMAEDVSMIDLDTTQLVVLSACETDIGISETGEGVLGLRRSFRLAGAESLVMTLWRDLQDFILDWKKSWRAEEKRRDMPWRTPFAISCCWVGCVSGSASLSQRRRSEFSKPPEIHGLCVAHP
jgi:CHAT domain-containing protein